MDSSVFVELFRKKNKESTLFYQLSQSDIRLAMSTVTYYEIGIGNRATHLDYWEELTGYIPVLPFDKLCADAAVQIYLDLIKRNKLIDLADLLIGATARAHQIPVATLNKQHFERISGLQVIP